MTQSEMSARTAPRPRHERRAETVARVLDAASALFEERGYSAVSVADIAARAGYTTGAVYANFSNKDALFLAVLDRRVGHHVAALLDAYRSGSTPEEGLASVAALYEQRLHEQFEWNLTLIEFTVRVRGDDELRRELQHRHRASRQVFAEAIAALAADRDHQLPAPAGVIASSLLGVGSGLLLEHLVDSDAPTVAAYRHTLFSALGVTDIAGSTHGHL